MINYVQVFSEVATMALFGLCGTYLFEFTAQTTTLIKIGTVILIFAVLFVNYVFIMFSLLQSIRAKYSNDAETEQKNDNKHTNAINTEISTLHNTSINPSSESIAPVKEGPIPSHKGAKVMQDDLVDYRPRFQNQNRQRYFSAQYDPSAKFHRNLSNRNKV